MKPGIMRLIHGRAAFAWVALATGAVLLLPLLVMQFTTEVQWTGFDFAIMGMLLFAMASGFVLLARKMRSRHWPWLAILFVLAFLAIWAQLAVGVFTRLGW